MSPPDRSRVFDVVRVTITEVLALDEAEVRLEHSLERDLGAESIDLLDLLFRFQRTLGVKMRREDIGPMLRGDLAREEFADADGKLTDEGVRQLRASLPQIDVEELRGTLHASDIFSLITVENLADLVWRRICAETSREP